MQTLNLAPELRSIFDQDIPRFSDCEYQRRQRALSDVMENASVDHLLVVSAQGTTLLSHCGLAATFCRHLRTILLTSRAPSAPDSINYSRASEHALLGVRR
jgi:hypothetical protein